MKRLYIVIISISLIACGCGRIDLKQLSKKEYQKKVARYMIDKSGFNGVVKVLKMIKKEVIINEL